MKVIRDYWREYTQEERKAVEDASRLPEREIGFKVRDILKRGKEYEVDLSGGQKMRVAVEEFCLKLKYISFNLLDSSGINGVSLSLVKNGEEIRHCSISLYELDIGDGKRIIIDIRNYDYFGRVIGWFSASEGRDYRIINEEGKLLQSGRLKNMEDFGNRLVEKAFSGFDLLVEGRAKEWLENWLSFARELLQEQIRQERKTLRR